MSPPKKPETPTDHSHRTIRVEGIDLHLSIKDERARSWLDRFTDSAHEPGTTRFLLEQLREAKVFADVGAYLGYFTCLASLAMRDGIVHSFEMVPENAALVQANVRLNDLRNVDLHQVAVSDHEGAESYLEGPDTFGASHRLQKRSLFQRQKVHRVKCVSLDAFFADSEPPDVVKIDVQGAEMSVLRGMERLLKNRRVVCFVEVHPGSLEAHYSSSSQEVLGYLADCGFSLSRIRDFRDKDSVLEPWTATEPLREEAMICAIPQRTGESA